LRKILVVAPNWIGDALMAQPLLARLREKLGRFRLEALAPPWVAPVLRRMPEVDEVIESDLRHGALGEERVEAVRSLLARHADDTGSYVLVRPFEEAHGRRDAHAVGIAPDRRAVRVRYERCGAELELHPQRALDEPRVEKG